ncbi:hypothetical protein Ahy_A08g039976 [Arachis hypogaea]|uniref:C-JID domain-containing protein n=1 Tax=Arachis hypogaea TaxID=3818 RepID=A0A445BXW6_ARAHY|nr:hypothetical protein Ahy_A08g039976 [Arachis hypogaea]
MAVLAECKKEVKQVLVIFDNVNQLEELEELVIKSLCARSRVIITGLSNLQYLDLKQCKSSSTVLSLLEISQGLVKREHKTHEVELVAKNTKDPSHFPCGFDIVVPGSVFPEWFSHQFKGDSIIRVAESNVNGNWIGFAFCASFKAKAKAPLTLQHPFYLSFETEEAEETFNLPLGLDMDMDKIDTSEHLFRLSTCIKE